MKSTQYCPAQYGITYPSKGEKEKDRGRESEGEGEREKKGREKERERGERGGDIEGE
jgi:hypothetical protein